VRENRVKLWELNSDRIIDSFSEGNLSTISSDGRVLAYGHGSPIAHITMSIDPEFIASYSIDGTIRIWGVAES
jgi:WD40 repeat protein